MAKYIAAQLHSVCSVIAVSTAILGAASASAQDRSTNTESQPASAPADAQDSSYENDIIVTASKRAERVQDVPGAISAIGGAQIENLGIKSFQDYVALVPGLSQRDNGTPGSGAIILRGLNTGPQQLTNTTAYYIDETPFSASGFISQGNLVTPEPELADVDHIEVLKGPQGTLYGASSLGGLIKLVTKHPDTGSFSGDIYADATAVDGGGEGFTLRGSVNIPVVKDVLAIRANGFYRRAPGFTDNIGTGTKNVNKSDFAGGRLSIRFTPTDRLTIDLNGVYQDIDSTGFAFTDTATGTLTPKFGRYKYSDYGDLPTTLRYRIANGTAEYRTELGTLTASASYARYETFFSSDATSTFGAFVPAGSRVLGDLSPNTNKFSSEIRFASRRIGPAEFVAGAFYTDEDSRYRSYYTVTDSTGAPLPAPLNVLVRTDTLSKYKEIAGFGNLTFYLSDQLDVTGGIRYAHNKEVGVTGAPSDAGSAVVFYVPRVAATFNFSDDSTSLLGTIRWRPSSNVSLFVRAAQGYRPGGPQTNSAPPPGAQTQIRPDTVWNYEAGIKAKTSDGALAVDLSVYHIDWKDIQLNTNYNNIILQSNGGDAKIDGAEAAITTRPSPTLTFTANVGYTNARISRADLGVRQSIGVADGDKLPLTPRFTLALTGDKRFAIGDAEAFVGSTMRYRSDMPSGYPGSASDPNLKIPDMTTVDLRAGVTLGRFDVKLMVSNIFNEYGVTSTRNNPYRVSIIRPRAFTVSLGALF